MSNDRRDEVRAQRPAFTQVPDALIPVLKGSEVKLWCAVFAASGLPGGCFMGRETIAAKMGVSLPTMDRAARSLARVCAMCLARVPAEASACGCGNFLPLVERVKRWRVRRGDEEPKLQAKDIAPEEWAHAEQTSNLWIARQPSNYVKSDRTLPRHDLASDPGTKPPPYPDSLETDRSLSGIKLGAPPPRFRGRGGDA